MYKPLTTEQVDIIKNIVKKWEKSTYAYAIGNMDTHSIKSLYYTEYKKPELIAGFLDLVITRFDRIKNYQEFKELDFLTIEVTETEITALRNLDTFGEIGIRMKAVERYHFLKLLINKGLITEQRKLTKFGKEVSIDKPTYTMDKDTEIITTTRGNVLVSNSAEIPTESMYATREENPRRYVIYSKHISGTLGDNPRLIIATILPLKIENVPYI